MNAIKLTVKLLQSHVEGDRPRALVKGQLFVNLADDTLCIGKTGGSFDSMDMKMIPPAFREAFRTELVFPESG